MNKAKQTQLIQYSNASRLVSREEQKILDRVYSEQTNLPTLILMENAGKALADAVLSLDLFIDDNADYDCLIFAGKGQNGGDGYVAARHLMAAGLQVALVDVSPESESPGDAAINRQAWLALNGEIITDLSQIESSSALVLIDAIFGSGFSPRGELDPNLAKAFALMNKLQKDGAKVVACDLPSGLVADTGQAISETVVADLTVSFGRAKIGLITHPGCLYSKEIMVEDLGMSSEFVRTHLNDEAVYLLDDYLVSGLVQDPAQDAHKGDNGRALLIGGSENMPGAMLLSMEACSRSGAGYTMARAPQELIPLLAQAMPSVLYSAIPNGKAKKKDLPGPIDAVAIGMGAGKADWIAKALNSLIPHQERLLIDADGLNCLAKMPNAQELLDKRVESAKEPLVLTPHPGEFKRLAPDLKELVEKDRLEAARRLAKRMHAIVVLKGMATVVAFPDGTAFINSSGNAGMAKGGSGDVLTGMIAGNMAVMRDSRKAVLLSVYLHGLAADLALYQYDDLRSLIPEDILDNIPIARQII